jgi:hypothetical protein
MIDIYSLPIFDVFINLVITFVTYLFWDLPWTIFGAFMQSFDNGLHYITSNFSFFFIILFFLIMFYIYIMRGGLD